ncbi:FKBP-type peptidyl-prolyl cis-trans isomerase FklB [Sulfurivirga caldicuralii]|uniref:Peptidyl-prolyl cis-trans isomerase n=1 Tax=Sulfurivirga caldicuralii TaxID=364032 RepID=A0A1N6GI30_9GAMM|nr:FKBP-type peptidyl-prolyl cis-trans isomerase [Sulfurivirga caldicuralii]SIO07166.1 FKBP-type peptidyl-prolyl cis-trans isomerase FklB [Sulfurivirga caldicuralii]
MKFYMTRALLGAGLIVVAWSGQAAELKTFEQKLGYALGADMAKGLQEQGLKADPDALLQGFKDQMAGRPSRLSDEELAQLAKETQARVIAHQQAELKRLARENAEKEKAFFAKLAKKKGVHKLAEGIYYEVLQSGKGPQPKADDTVVVHYTGTLLNGKVFDSSVKRGTPLRLQVNQVIRGWQIVLPKMHVGDKWKVYIPSRLAYGERGAGKAIGPNEPLIFEIELLNIEPRKDEKK